MSHLNDKPGKIRGKRRNKNKNTGEAVRTSGFTFAKSLGQHILKNPLVVKTMIERAGLRASDVVLEIGPGTGALTIPLLRTVKKVICIEFDPRMAAEITKRAQSLGLSHKLELIVGDAMKVPFPRVDAVLSNLPYQISSPFIFKLLAQERGFRCAVIMMQREFCLRLVAKPGSPMYCRLSANVQLLAKVDHIMKVSRNSFRPPPKVESSVVRIEQRNPRPPVDFLEWDGLARLCFSRKNKTLGAVFRGKNVLKMLEKNYKTYCSLNSVEPDPRPIKELVNEVLDSGDFAGRRAAKMDNDDLLALLEAFNSHNIHFNA